MTPADLARQNALSFECKKDSLRQSQSGDWKIAFTVQGLDMDERLTKAFPGTRYMAVLVEIGTDELPVHQPEKEQSSISEKEPATPEVAHDKPPLPAKRERRDWNDIPPTTQAGIRSNDQDFEAFLRSEYPDDWHETGGADECLKSICGVVSKKELMTDQRARILWVQLDKHFQAHEAKLRMNA